MNGGSAGGFSQLTIFSTKVNYLFLFFRRMGRIENNMQGNK